MPPHKHSVIKGIVMESVGTVFPTMPKRKEWKGECGKAPCSDCSLTLKWRENSLEVPGWAGRRTRVSALKGSQVGAPHLEGLRSGCGTPPDAAPHGSRVSQHCSAQKPQQCSQEIIPVWGMGDLWSYTNSLQTFNVRLWPHVTHSFLKSNLLGFYHSQSMTVLSNYQNLTSEKASICLPSYFNLLSCAISPSGYWLEFCFVLSPWVIQGDTELAEYIRSLYAS